MSGASISSTKYRQRENINALMLFHFFSTFKNKEKEVRRKRRREQEDKEEKKEEEGRVKKGERKEEAFKKNLKQILENLKEKI